MAAGALVGDDGAGGGGHDRQAQGAVGQQRPDVPAGVKDAVVVEHGADAPALGDGRPRRHLGHGQAAGEGLLPGEAHGAALAAVAQGRRGGAGTAAEALVAQLQRRVARGPHGDQRAAEPRRQRRQAVDGGQHAVQPHARARRVVAVDDVGADQRGVEALQRGEQLVVQVGQVRVAAVQAHPDHGVGHTTSTNAPLE